MYVKEFPIILWFSNTLNILLNLHELIINCSGKVNWEFLFKNLKFSKIKVIAFFLILNFKMYLHYIP